MARGGLPAYRHFMKMLLICAIVGAGIFLTACRTTYVERHHNHATHGYYDHVD